MSSHTNRLIRRTAQRCFSQRTKLTLLSLTNDTLVDLISVYLCVRDILRLRPVCRLLYHLTHQEVVWKRILRTFHLHLPPLPPTIRYSFPELGSLESERLVTRALSAEANWRSAVPKAYNAWKFSIDADAMSMKIVPGGKYALVSVREGQNRYALMLLMMEHRVKIAYPVAKIATASKAYKLEAKYIRYETEMGIMISYLRREPKREEDRMAGVDVSDYSDEHVIDFRVPVRYELQVLHCPLSALQVAEDPRFPPGSDAYNARIDAQPSPFKIVTGIRSTTAFDFIDLDVLDGAPHVVASQGRIILFKNLASRHVHRIRVGALVGYEDEPSDVHPNGIFTYDIRAIRILAPQRELLVVRTDRKDVSMPLVLELYKVPNESEFSQAEDPPRTWPRSVHTIATASRVMQVTISAVPSTTDGEDAATVLTAHAEPPPVSIFVVMRNPWHTVQFRLWPERIPKTEVGHFRPDSEWQTELQEAMFAAAAANAGQGGGVNEAPNEGGGDPALEDGEEEGQVDLALNEGIDPDDGSDDDAMAVDEPSSPTTPPQPPPVPLKDTTFHFQLYGPFFKIVSYKYSANESLGTLRVLPGTTRPLLVGFRAGDRRATPALHDLWAYADLVPPPAPHARWPQDEERRAAGEAERGWVDDALKRRESPAAVAQLALPPREIREKFSRGLVAIEWDDWSMSMCAVCVGEPKTIYLFQFAPTPTEERDGHRYPVPVPDVDRRFREVPEDDPFGMAGIVQENANWR